jgi:hypothetical protein
MPNDTCEAGNPAIGETCGDADCICSAAFWPKYTIIELPPGFHDAQTFGIVIADSRYLPYAAA